MNLLVINCTYDTFTPGHSGAISTWVRQICSVAEADGVRPLLITRSSPHPQYDRPDTIMIDYPKLPAGRAMSKVVGLQKRLAGWVRPRQGAYCDRVSRAIRQAGASRWPMVLHNDMELAVSLRRRFPQARIFHLSHNANGTTERFRRRFGQAVDVAMAVSDYCSRWNEQFYRLPAGTVKTLYNGVDLEAFRPRQDQSTAMPIINFVGKLDRNKAPDVLLKAARRLAERTRSFSLQIVGRQFYDREEVDDYTRDLHRLAAGVQAAGVECRFTGWMDRTRVPGLLGAAHISVIPSRWDEPSALTIYEAMASGMAVVGSNTGGTPEVIGDAGFLFDRDDDAGLAGVLERLVCDAALRAEYGRRARARAERFSWAATWGRLKELITRALPCQ